MNKLLVSVAASVALLAAAPTMAQQQNQQQQQDPAAQQGQGSGYSDPAAAGTQDTNFSDSELKEFIKAQEGVMEVREDYIEKIEAADSQEKAQELQMEANDKMVSVIEEVGMDIPTYNSIATAYSSEPKVRNRIDALM
jgi:opacity protein-like surface antigen